MQLFPQLAILAAVAWICPTAHAQGFNMDVGRANASPSSTYSAAAGQPGFWNNFRTTGGGALLDLNGAPSAVSVSASVAHNFHFGFDNLTTTGDDELLLDAGHDGALTMEFVGLLDGEYLVYTYAWAPDKRTTYITNVHVPGSPDSLQAVGGAAWTGVHVEGETFAKHRVTVTGGAFSIVCTIGMHYATVNGVQIEPAPVQPPVIAYCTAKTNSLGCVPAISGTGTPSATAGSGFLVSSANNRNLKSGILFYGMSGRANIPFQGGTLCVKVPIKRTPAVFSGGSPAPANDCTGVYSIDMNAFATGAGGGTPAPELVIPGTLVDCQFWGRDPGFAAPENTSLSDGLEYTVGP